MAPKRRREDGGGGGNKKKHWSSQSSKGPLIPENSRGFLVSCVTGKEMLASQEAIELLGQYMEGGQQGAQQQPAKAGGSDISALIAEEVADIKSGSGQPLTWHKTNITGLLYIALDKAAGVGPVELVEKMATDIQAKKQCKSRLCLRFIPVEHVCSAKLEQMKELAAKVLPEALPARDEAAEPEMFAVQYEHRASTDLKRMDVINAFVDHVPKGYKVSLDKAQHTILVQLVKSCCTVAVVPRYKELLKFNVRELSGFGDGAAAAAAKAGKDVVKAPAAAAGAAAEGAVESSAAAAAAGTAVNGSTAEPGTSAAAPEGTAAASTEAAVEPAAAAAAAADTGKAENDAGEAKAAEADDAA